jgi:hypothetical protein
MVALAALLAGAPGGAARAQARAGWSESLTINPDVGASQLSRQAQREDFGEPALVNLETLSCASPRFCVAVGGALEAKANGPRHREYKHG